jgi:hypothetical protein
VNPKQLKESIDLLMKYVDDVYHRQEIYRLACYTRDIDNGKGERAVTYMLLLALTMRGYGHEVIEILKLFTSVGYGYFGDFVNFYCHIEKDSLYVGDEHTSRKKSMQESIIKILSNQIRNDERLLKKNHGTSLAAKWVPSEGRQKDFMAKVIAFTMFPPKKSPITGTVSDAENRKSLTKYRKLISKLRKPLELVESMMSSNEWGEIQPKYVPAKAMKKYRKVFMNSKGSVDPGRVLLAKKLTELLSRKTDKTIKTKGLQFYELIKPYVDGGAYDEVLEVQAKTIIAEMKALVENGSFPLSVALCDVSGSMSGVPMVVSIALGIIVANVMPEPWEGRVITFETRPRWVSINPSSTIHQQVQVLREAPWGGSTNFAAAVDLVLQGALSTAEPKKSIPEILFCFTDMQFNAASERNTFVIDDLKRKFQDHGLVMPKIILWNLRASGTNTFAADKDTDGVGILSGFSQSTFKAFMSGCNFELMTPIYLLKEALHIPEYDVIANCAKE